MENLTTPIIWNLFSGLKGDEVKQLVDDHMNGKINVNFLVTGQLTMDQINEGFDLLNKGQGYVYKN